MHAYGIDRTPDSVNPDSEDIKKYGFQSSKSRIRKHGTIKNSFRSIEAKARIRRIWKKKERSLNKKTIDRMFSEWYLEKDFNE